VINTLGFFVLAPLFHLSIRINLKHYSYPKLHSISYD